MNLTTLNETERRDLIGQQVAFTVRRDGQPIARHGTVTRVTDKLIWISAYCYTHGDVHDLRLIREQAA